MLHGYYWSFLRTDRFSLQRLLFDHNERVGAEGVDDVVALGMAILQHSSKNASIHLPKKFTSPFAKRVEGGWKSNQGSNISTRV